MKKILSIVLTTVLIVSALTALTGCGDKKIKEFDLSDVTDEITEAIKFTDLYKISSDDLYQETGIKNDTYSEAVCLLPTDSTEATRMLFIKAIDSEAASAIETKLNNYLEQQKITSETYSPDMFAIFKKASVVKSDNYVYLVVTDKQNEANSVISKYDFK